MAKIGKLLKQAEEHFDDGECALQTVFGVYETKIMGSDSVRNGIFIATDQRLRVRKQREDEVDLNRRRTCFRGHSQGADGVSKVN